MARNNGLFSGEDAIIFEQNLADPKRGYCHILKGHMTN